MLHISFLILNVLDCANKGNVEMLEGKPITVYAVLTLTLQMADQPV